MWIVMIASYLLISIIDIKSFLGNNEKGMLPVYITLMAISCAIGIANGYIPNMPSPANPIKNMVLYITGR